MTKETIDHGLAAAPVRLGLGELAVLPVFFPLDGKRAVIAGATERAVWKAELLHATGAQVDVYAAVPCAEMRALADGSPHLYLVERVWQAADLCGAAIALVDTLDDGEAERFRHAARAAAVPMNAIDNPAFCDFQFGAIVNRSPLVIGVSTHGAAPVFGQAIRGRLETLLPPRLQDWAKAARAWRERIVPLHLPFQARRHFWERFSNRALSADGPAPHEADFKEFLEAATCGRQRGRRWTERAGDSCRRRPGRSRPHHAQGPAGASRSADVVLYDNLVAPAVVEMARREGAEDRRRQARLPALLQAGRHHGNDGGAGP